MAPGGYVSDTRRDRAKGLALARWGVWATVLAICGLHGGFTAGQSPPLNDFEKELADAREKDRLANEHPRLPFVPPGLETPPDLRFEREFQRGVQCGPNAVFAVLRAFDVPITLDEVTRAIPVGDQGATMDNLKKGCEHFGLVCEMRKQVSPSELAAVNGPAIVHLAYPGVGKESGRQHFAVVLKYDEKAQEFSGIDTTSLGRVKFFPAVLSRTMSGCVLFPVRPDASRTAAGTETAGSGRWFWGAALVLVVLANIAVPLYARVCRARGLSR